MQIRVFSMATSSERANVPMASASVRNFVKFPKVKFPDESWKAYSMMIIRGSATNSTRKMA
jgi:hypothetical protein